MGKWETVKLSDLFDIGSSKRVFESEWRSSGVPFYRAREIVKLAQGGFVDNELYIEEALYDKYVLKYGTPAEGDIMVTGVGTLGVCYIVKSNDKFYFKDGNILWFKKKSNIDSRYITALFETRLIKEQIARSAGGSTVGTFTISTACNITIPLPPLHIQQKIADALDKASALIEMRKAQIEKLDLLIKSQFIEMFGDPVTNPMGWEKHLLSDFIIFMTSGSRGWSEYFTPKGEMFLTIKNVRNSKLLLGDIQFVIPPMTKEAQRTRVQEDDLLISITADLGRTAVVSSEISSYGAYINQHLALIRLDRNNVAPIYVSYFLESKAGVKQFEAKNQIGVKSGLNFEAIKSLIVLIPPLPMQMQFVSFVNRVDEQKKYLHESLISLELNYKSLMQKCFSGEMF